MGQFSGMGRAEQTKVGKLARSSRENGLWHCPLGCGKTYRKSSSRSIQKHRTNCFTSFIQIDTSGRWRGGVLFSPKIPFEEQKGVSPELMQDKRICYLCIGRDDGSIANSYRAPHCREDPEVLVSKCQQILLHASRSKTSMVQMMASNSDMVYYHQTAKVGSESLTFIVAVSSFYKGDPPSQVLSDFRKTYKAKVAVASEHMTPDEPFTSAMVRSADKAREQWANRVRYNRHKAASSAPHSHAAGRYGAHRYPEAGRARSPPSHRSSPVSRSREGSPVSRYAARREHGGGEAQRHSGYSNHRRSAGYPHQPEFVDPKLEELGRPTPPRRVNRYIKPAVASPPRRAYISPPRSPRSPMSRSPRGMEPPYSPSQRRRASPTFRWTNDANLSAPQRERLASYQFEPLPPTKQEEHYQKQRASSYQDRESMGPLTAPPYPVPRGYESPDAQQSHAPREKKSPVQKLVWQSQMDRQSSMAAASTTAKHRRLNRYAPQRRKSTPQVEKRKMKQRELLYIGCQREVRLLQAMKRYESKAYMSKSRQCLLSGVFPSDPKQAARQQAEKYGSSGEPPFKRNRHGYASPPRRHHMPSPPPQQPRHRRPEGMEMEMETAPSSPPPPPLPAPRMAKRKVLEGAPLSAAPQVPAHIAEKELRSPIQPKPEAEQQRRHRHSVREATAPPPPP